ncbi:hypothetical protein [Lacibacter sediminis]|uniref:Uncharacterized protein n=1 Tax=Lacibacter sediminis TaxID=2760713 RepID=A0A7G5XKP5_9BACT|nr:hypothetical protein [Lacibacter sediminis]QNA46048.1 hypothetical protein H4075_07655 [Lacibacter sediminis]
MKKYIIIFILSIACIHGYSQFTDAEGKKVSAIVNSQKTANSKDILSTFFRASIDDLLGDDRKFSLNSTFFGLDSVFRKKGKEISYSKERRLRQTSFNIGLEGDSLSSITKISGGFTFTIMNKKDITLKKIKSVDKNALVKSAFILADIKTEILAYIAKKYPAKFNDVDTLKDINLSWTNASANNDFSSLHPLIVEALLSPGLAASAVKSDASLGISEDDVELTVISLLKGKNTARDLYDAIGEKYSRKPLWTFSPTVVYDRNNRQGEYFFASEFTVGIGKDLSKKPWEIEVKSAFKITNDTATKKVNYDSKPFSISLGANKVLIENETKEPKMEFKFFTQYDYQFGKVQVGEKPGIFSLNTTLRINIFKSLWLPLTVKYDVENGNFLGFLAVTANLGN